MTLGREPVALLRPGEAAVAIGIKPSTLRVYVQRFGELLSEEVASTQRPGYRLYTARDVDLLRRAKQMLARGFTYERTAAELRPAAAAVPERAAVRRRGRRTDDEAAVTVEVLQSAVAAWRGLAEERAAEIAALREEIRQLRELLVAQRRPVTALPARHRQRV
jgi:DNA-binding transcriptional MerR regulator